MKMWFRAVFEISRRRTGILAKDPRFERVVQTKAERRESDG